MSWYPASETDAEREERLRAEVPAQPVTVSDRASKVSANPPATAASSQPAPAAMINLLAKKHEGMRVDYSGLLRQCQQSLKHSGDAFNAEMLGQLQEHLKELGERWYAGDTAVVDEILQLYCIEKSARAALVTNVAQGHTHE